MSVDERTDPASIPQGDLALLGHEVAQRLLVSTELARLAYVAADGVAADDVKQHVRSQLAGYKVPRDVVFLDELPRNATGKVLKRELEEREAPEKHAAR
jgi:acyl-CoA synthetase (AMP-forming)/AMP-acid ligase II